ncbi:MAG: phage tail protein [Chloroflexi bacterium]|nr:MAG: phage tail protein [Chloroflexota bacterium]
MDPFLGEIKIVSFNFAPRGWAACDGQILQNMQNQTLFSLLGTLYGGNGTTTFALPDFRGKVPLHFGAGFIQGQSGGETAHTLTLNEMPAHTHTVAASNADPDVPLPGGNVWPAVTNGYAGTPNATMNPAALVSTGGQPHENRQPYLVLNFVIALQGVYPTRD